MNEEKLELKFTITKDSSLVDVNWTGKITPEQRDAVEEIQNELFSVFFKNKKNKMKEYFRGYKDGIRDFREKVKVK